jgi:phosphoribosyl 1,2-cyclic phosphate phosphodiesterase
MAKMKLTFLGTGTSFGIPVVGCDCPACTSEDPRDRRTRHGALLETEQGRLLVDTPPELRLQLLEAGVDLVHAVWFTHIHADHVHGIDDLRVFTVRGRDDIPAYVGSEYRDAIAHHFRYIFDEGHQPSPGSSRPGVQIHDLRPGEPVRILGHSFVPVEVPHGAVSVYGFRVGTLGYVTDGKVLPPTALEALRGVEVLVLNALWFGRPHPSHFNVEEAVDAAAQVGATRTYLTHLTHRVTHAELLSRLPAGVEPAYDGLTIEVD